MTIANPHLAPPMPIWGVVGPNIDRCIIMKPLLGSAWGIFLGILVDNYNPNTNGDVIPYRTVTDVRTCMP
jgi:hypothetical protein